MASPFSAAAARRLITAASRTTLSLNTESLYDWERRQWTVPVNAGVNQLVRVGDHLMQFGVFGRYFPEAPSSAPRWGAQLRLTFVFPR